VSKGEIARFLGDQVPGNVDSIHAWNQVAKNWNVWFLRRPNGKKGDEIDEQWGRAIGPQKVVHIDDELRAVDYAMGLIARDWGYFDDFRANMSARQDEKKVGILERALNAILAV
jgi:hypothetical protein